MTRPDFQAAPGRCDRARRREHCFWSSLAVAALLLAQVAGAAETPMDEEIDYLINVVAESQCTFIRNGKEHDAQAAADHLQMKRKRGRRYYDTTEEFIERIASRSSWSGKDYLIRCGSAEAQTANAWFSAKLAAHRAGDAD